jgi:hypothetical protein
MTNLQINLQLKQITLSKDSCKNDDIKSNIKYLAIIYGHMHIGTCSKQWYGWNFGPWVNGVGVQLDGIDSIYEILNPEVLENYGKLPPPPVSRDDDDFQSHLYR